MNEHPSWNYYYPSESDDVLSNPYKGFVADARYPKHMTQPVTMAHVNIYWDELEPEKGKYEFDKLEERYHFDTWRKMGG